MAIVVDWALTLRNLIYLLVALGLRRLGVELIDLRGRFIVGEGLLTVGNQ